MTNSGKLKCAFCRNHQGISIHHNYNYIILSIFLRKRLKPKLDAEHMKVEHEADRIQREGGYLPLCVGCHHAWEILLNKMVSAYANRRKRFETESETIKEMKE